MELVNLSDVIDYDNILLFFYLFFNIIILFYSELPAAVTTEYPRVWINKGFLILSHSALQQWATADSPVRGGFPSFGLKGEQLFVQQRWRRVRWSFINRDQITAGN